MKSICPYMKSRNIAKIESPTLRNNEKATTKAKNEKDKFSLYGLCDALKVNVRDHFHILKLHTL